MVVPGVQLVPLYVLTLTANVVWYRLRLLPGTDGATAVWNDEFQDVVEMAATTPQEVKNRSRSIKEIARTFADTAKVRPRWCLRCTRTALPTRRVLWLSPVRTASQPVAAGIIQERNASGGAVNVGGVAGGLKYSVKGQFFKFAVDQGLYVALTLPCHCSKRCWCAWFSALAVTD